jgi:hypothetical protein
MTKMAFTRRSLALGVTLGLVAGIGIWILFSGPPGSVSPAVVRPELGPSPSPPPIPVPPAIPPKRVEEPTPVAAAGGEASIEPVVEAISDGAPAIATRTLRRRQ